MNRGKAAESALSGGRMNYLPGFGEESTGKSVPDCIRDIWAMIEGHNMIYLNFSNLLAAVNRLRLSLKEELRSAIAGMCL